MLFIKGRDCTCLKKQSQVTKRGKEDSKLMGEKIVGFAFCEKTNSTFMVN